jgi:hypothetical protein
VLSRAGLWSVQHLRFARCLGAIGLRLDYKNMRALFEFGLACRWAIAGSPRVLSRSTFRMYPRSRLPRIEHRNPCSFVLTRIS